MEGIVGGGNSFLNNDEHTEIFKERKEETLNESAFKKSLPNRSDNKFH